MDDKTVQEMSREQLLTAMLMYSVNQVRAATEVMQGAIEHGDWKLVLVASATIDNFTNSEGGIPSAIGKFDPAAVLELMADTLDDIENNRPSPAIIRFEEAMKQRGGNNMDHLVPDSVRNNQPTGE